MREQDTRGGISGMGLGQHGAARGVLDRQPAGVGSVGSGVAVVSRSGYFMQGCIIATSDRPQTRSALSVAASASAERAASSG